VRLGRETPIGLGFLFGVGPSDREYEFAVIEETLSEIGFRINYILLGDFRANFVMRRAERFSFGGRLRACLCSSNAKTAKIPSGKNLVNHIGEEEFGNSGAQILREHRSEKWIVRSARLSTIHPIPHDTRLC